MHQKSHTKVSPLQSWQIVSTQLESQLLTVLPSVRLWRPRALLGPHQSTPLRMSTKEMTEGSLHDMVDDHMATWNWRKTISFHKSFTLQWAAVFSWSMLGTCFLMQLKKADKMYKKHQIAFECFNKTFTPKSGRLWSLNGTIGKKGNQVQGDKRMRMLHQIPVRSLMKVLDSIFLLGMVLIGLW